MGASFDDRIFMPKKPGDRKELEDKFWQIVEECLHWHGHGGYTGTFAEKDPDEILVIDEIDGLKKEIWTHKEAREHAMEHNDKWGPVFAYRLKGDSWYIAGWCSS